MPEKYLTVPEFLTRLLQILQMHPCLLQLCLRARNICFFWFILLLRHALVEPKA